MFNHYRFNKHSCLKVKNKMTKEQYINMKRSVNDSENQHDLQVQDGDLLRDMQLLQPPVPA